MKKNKKKQKTESDKQDILQDIKEIMPIKVVSSHKLCVPCERNAIVRLFLFFHERNFISEQEQILRLIDRPELLDSQILSFYHKKDGLRFDIILKNPEKFYKKSQKIGEN